MTRRWMLALLAQAGVVDAKVVLDQSVTLDEGNMAELRRYVWTSEETASVKGRVTRQQRYEINLLSGGLYWRKLTENGEPLKGEEAAAERQRLERHLASAPRAARRSRREYLELLPHAHRVQYRGMEEVKGRACHVLETEPLPGNHAPLVGAFAYRLWVDQKELHWARAEITVRRKVEWLLNGLDIGRLSYPYSNNIVNTGNLSAGARRTIELERLPGGVWTLARMETVAGQFRNELRYFDYRRFESESQLLAEP